LLVAEKVSTSFLAGFQLSDPVLFCSELTPANSAGLVDLADDRKVTGM